jgi:CheY-like chemotaxis protein
MIEAKSEPGKGTTFELYLPATGRCLLDNRKETPKIQKGSGRVLILEDEEVVSKSLGRMLKELGYTFELTEDGNETVRIYAEQQAAGRPFDLVIMDLTIPGGLGGKEAVKELRKIAPKVPVIVSSGYSDEAVMADYKGYGFDAVLPKPYKYEDLAELLSRLLKK